METKQPLQETLFFDLLLTTLCTDTSDPPASMTKDIRAGIQYAFSTLEESEQRVLLLRCGKRMSCQKAAVYLGISQEDVQALEGEALRKLRMPGRWNYIRHGVAGYLRLRLQEERRTAYQKGYCDGSQKAKAHKEKEQAPDLPIEALGLSVRAQHCLTRARITSVREAAAYNERNILYIRNLGPKTAEEIALALRRHGVTGTPWDQYLPDTAFEVL